jgi:murein L,D-transpeptidase YcbB/YkuD
VNSLRTQRTGRSRPVRLLSAVGVAAALVAAAAPLPLAPFEAQAQTSSSSYGLAISDFYAARGDRPLWFGEPGRQAEVLLELLASADLDRLEPDRYRVRSLERAVRAARNGDRRAVQRAEKMLSKALVDYVSDLRRPAGIGTIFVDPELRPAPPSPRGILEAAAAAPSLEGYVARMGWMHPLYGELRHALMSGAYSGEQRDRIMVNLERARELPAGRGRHVLVNAAAQRLFMYEGNQVVDSMRVVVGKPKYATPMMAALIRFASLNPYWYVPPDLAAERIAPGVVKEGLRYLRARGYEVLESFEGSPSIVDPSTIDWQAVADGREQVYIRQKPGPGNAMGRMKFMFPNMQGIYLHDTPEKELLEEASRLFSGGCVRLQDAARLGEWLYGERLKPQGAKAEQQVPLDRPVPVYITYLTAVPSGNFQLAFFEDIYGRDAQRLAQMRGGRTVAARR